MPAGRLRYGACATGPARVCRDTCPPQGVDQYGYPHAHPPHALPPGTCGGGNAGNHLCALASECCNRWGNCGTSAGGCDANGIALGGPTAIYGTQACGSGVRGSGACASGQGCCSPYGYCGSGADYCNYAPLDFSKLVMALHLRQLLLRPYHHSTPSDHQCNTPPDHQAGFLQASHECSMSLGL